MLKKTSDFFFKELTFAEIVLMVKHCGVYKEQHAGQSIQGRSCRVECAG